VSDPSRLDDVVTRLRAAGCVFAEEEAALLRDAATGDRLEALLARRQAGEPLEHVLGWVAFAGRRWAVAPGVFVPRQRSELLVDVALAAVRPTSDAVVVDLCCGNGALGGAVAAALAGPSGEGDASHVVLHAADIDPAATACAAANLEPLGGVVHTGDLYAALPTSLRGHVDLLLCHAPYVPTAAIELMPPEAREHEPLAALDGGPDGLDVLRRVICEAPAWLAPGGTLLFELGDERQVATVQALLAREGLGMTVHGDDETGATVVTGTAPER
jgi:release factor glutamine methyltransferase